MITVIGLVSAMAGSNLQAIPECPERFTPGEWYSCQTALDQGETLTWTMDGGNLVLSQQMSDGRRQQTSTYTDSALWGAPRFSDLDQDGDEEMIATLFCGMVNCTYAVYQRDADGWFTYAGQGGGFGIKAAEAPGGLLTDTARSSAAVYVYTTWLLDEDGLHLVYEIDKDHGMGVCHLRLGSAFGRSLLVADEVLADCTQDLTQRVEEVGSTIRDMGGE